MHCFGRTYQEDFQLFCGNTFQNLEVYKYKKKKTRTSVFSELILMLKGHRFNSVIEPCSTQKLRINLLCINRDLLSEFLSHLKKGRSLALLIDGADLVHDATGQRISDWIPQRVPKVIYTYTRFTDIHYY